MTHPVNAFNCSCEWFSFEDWKCCCCGANLCGVHECPVCAHRPQTPAPPEPEREPGPPLTAGFARPGEDYVLVLAGSKTLCKCRGLTARGTIRFEVYGGGPVEVDPTVPMFPAPGPAKPASSTLDALRAFYDELHNPPAPTPTPKRAGKPPTPTPPPTAIDSSMAGTLAVLRRAHGLLGLGYPAYYAQVIWAVRDSAAARMAVYEHRIQNEHRARLGDVPRAHVSARLAGEVKDLQRQIAQLREENGALRASHDAALTELHVVRCQKDTYERKLNALRMALKGVLDFDREYV